MDNLVYSCTDPLSQPTPPACSTDYGEKIIGIAFMKKGGTFSVSGSDYATKSEFDVAIAAGEITFYSGISNAHRVEQGATELSGDDTITGGTERYDVRYRIEGRIRLLSEAISRATERLDRFSELMMWYFTNKNYVFGGPTGYLVTPNFGLKIFEGVGQPPYIPFFCDFVATGSDNAGYDADFHLLTNP